jgi:hypothetical protein
MGRGEGRTCAVLASAAATLSVAILLAVAATASKACTATTVLAINFSNRAWKFSGLGLLDQDGLKALEHLGKLLLMLGDVGLQHSSAWDVGRVGMMSCYNRTKDARKKEIRRALWVVS